MNFSSLVLMERETETNHLIREMGSYEVGDGAEYIRKFYFDGSAVNVVFEVLRDVEDWEYSAVFDLFDEKSFKDSGFKIEQIDDEYNPMWIVTMDYIEDHMTMQEKVNKLCGIIYESMDKVFKDIEGREKDYK